MKKQVFLFSALVLLLACFVVLDGVLTSRMSISSYASVKSVGVAVYWDANCTFEVASIDWGMVEPNSSVDVDLYVLGVGNANVTLFMSTESWSPAEASLYLSLSWDAEGSVVEPEQVLPVQLSLSCSANVTGITDFSFDIIVMGSG